MRFSSGRCVLVISSGSICVSACAAVKRRVSEIVEVSIEVDRGQQSSKAVKHSTLLIILYLYLKEWPNLTLKC